MGPLCEPREEVGRYFAEFERHRFAVEVPAGPPRVVSRRDRHVRMAQLPRDVAELNARGKELRGECVAQVLGRAALDPSAPEDASPVAVAEVETFLLRGRARLELDAA